jgi:hypothetical protein
MASPGIGPGYVAAQSAPTAESAPGGTEGTDRRVAQLEEMVARTHERAAELYETWLARQVDTRSRDLEWRAQRHRELAAKVRSVERVAARTLDGFESRIETGTPRAGKARQLLVLSALERLRVLVDARIATTVEAGRREGATWAEIAAALGITRQSAHERYRRHAD